MTRMSKGLALALIQLLIVASLGGKLLYDRHTLPRLWVETVSFDPNLPIRGRYVSLRIVVEPDTGLQKKEEQWRQNEKRWQRPAVQLRVQDGRLIAEATPTTTAQTHIQFIDRNKEKLAVLDERLAFFLTENVPDPSRRPAGETLWAEVTVPKNGPPRPIRLGVKKGDGAIEPLALKSRSATEVSH